MRKLWIGAPLALALLVLAFVVSVAPADNDSDSFRAELDGFQETPSVSTTGRGSFKAEVDGDEIDYRLRYSGLENPVTVAHIHFAQRHVSGGVIAFLCGGGGKPDCPQSGEVRGTITADDVDGPSGQGIEEGEIDEVIRALKEESVYANVHTSKFTGGEIRGQVDGGDGDDDDDGDD